MSFKDFNDEGPGTFGWDYVLGANTTGLFPDETHYELEGDLLTEVTYSHTGGGKLEASSYGFCCTVTNISPITGTPSGEQWLTFEQDGSKFKATLNKKFKQSKECYVVDVVEIG